MLLIKNSAYLSFGIFFAYICVGCKMTENKIMKITEFQKKLKDIRSKGFIRSKRKGPTGVGYTLESELGIKENNIAVPDLGFAELKSHRENHTGLVTLFTFNRNAWKIAPLLAIEKYGSYDTDNRRGMYYTVTQKPNSVGLFLTCNDDTIQVQHTSGEVILQWAIDSVAERFSKKIKSLVLVSAKIELRSGYEYFYYYRARLLQGNMSKQGLVNAFISGDFVIDLRLHDKITMARNHGTAFRVKENKLINLFSNISELEL